MKRVFSLLLSLLWSLPLYAAVSPADYARAAELQKRYRDLADDIVGEAHWVEGEHALLYSKAAHGSLQFFVYNADTGATSPAFDQKRLAAALALAAHTEVRAEALPVRRATLRSARKALDFSIGYQPWRCDLVQYTCEEQDQRDEGEDPNAHPELRNSAAKTLPSPDGKWKAEVLNYNVSMVSADEKQTVALSTDGSEGNYYAFSSLAWSPDSQYLVAYRVRPGYRRMLRFVQSSPPHQLQPLYPEVEYTKPGDVLDLQQPVLFDLGRRSRTDIDPSLFPNPFDLSPAQWWKDSRGFTFDYNARGHQLYRVIEVDAATGKPRTLINEASATFVDYRPLVPEQQDTGKVYRHDLNDGVSILWASERDGWEHLYLLDGKTGNVQTQITNGDWVVRSVDRVDEKSGTVWYSASGTHAGEDPYYIHAYRVQLDGSGRVEVTPSAGNHRVGYSDDGAYFFDLVSTPRMPPVLSIAHTAQIQALKVLVRGDATRLTAAGWVPPEPFHAKGRDGKTDIWGEVWKPRNFNAARKYPVVENIYAGPQGSFVPKAFSTRTEALTELGFVVVQIDGMGTNNRSKAFHNVAWKNLKDAGFEDRIAWHRAYAATHPWYDITRVGIFGTSAGGQSAMGALLFHADFYKAAVANSGCHDNRMDKIWWNEQWMGWPIGPQYAASSNVDNAWRLQGKLMLVVGELDDNVDPSSTFQVVDRLEKANKQFSLLYVPGGKHGAGGAYGERELQAFFVQSLLGEAPPDWNREQSPAPALVTVPAPTPAS